MSEIPEAAMPPVPEPILAGIAPLALAWSRDLCRHVNPSGRTCAGYHGIWQYLRWFGIINPPVDDVPFLRDALGQAAAAGARRVLVCGCADYAVPATVHWAFAQAEAQADLTVIDICETPLRICGWYADRTGLPLQTVATDIFDYRPPQPFDIVCTHSLLGLFSPETRGALLARWRELLASGGLVVTVNRIAPDAPPLERFSATQGQAFRERFLSEAMARPDRALLGAGMEELAALADAFVAQNVVYPVRTEQYLRELFEGAGFQIHTLKPRAPSAVKLSGPTQGAGAPVVQIVAVRR